VSTAAEALAGNSPSLVEPSAEVNPIMAKPVGAVPKGVPFWWLLLVLAATLAILWLFVSVQLARTAFKRRAA
jgi:hypothetical protein